MILKNIEKYWQYAHQGGMICEQGGKVADPTDKDRSLNKSAVPQSRQSYHMCRKGLQKFICKKRHL